MSGGDWFWLGGAIIAAANAILVWRQMPERWVVCVLWSVVALDMFEKITP